MMIVSYPRKSAFKPKHQIGDQIGRLTIISRAGTTPRRGIIWECRCECGVIKSVRSDYLKQGGTLSCGCLKRESLYRRHYQGTQDIPATYWRQILRGASIRGLEVTVTIEDLQQLLDKQDHKCGLTSFPLTFQVWNAAAKKYIPGNASLDRIDSSRGYTPDNIMWIDKDVNMMKKEYGLDRFLAVCEAVSDLRRQDTH